jgi:hypothetical protein
MSLILNSGLYRIRNVANGAIDQERGALAAVGTANDELVVSRGPYDSPLYVLSDTTMDRSGKSL